MAPAAGGSGSGGRSSSAIGRRLDPTAPAGVAVPAAAAAAAAAARQPTSRLLLAFLLIASAPDGSRSFLFPSRGGGAEFWCRRCRGDGDIAMILGGAVRATATGGAARGAAAGPPAWWRVPGGRSGATKVMAAINPAAVAFAPRRGRKRPTGKSTASSSPSSSCLGSTAAAAEAAAAAGSPHKMHFEGDDHPSVEGGHEDKDDRVPTAGELLVQARDLYNQHFGAPHDEDVPNVCAGYAPGRVNLIGEHTDYNGGFVMPLALERGTVVYGTGRLVDSDDDGVAEAGSARGWCRVVSETMQQQAGGEEGEGDVRFRADESLEPGEPEWANYVKGVVKEFMAKIPEGKRLEFGVTVVGAVPLGGGVSSSASLSVAMATFLQGVLASSGVSPPTSKEKAHLCRMAEHNFLDMPCGIMDQFVTSMALSGHAMLLDCRSQEPDAVPLSDSNLMILVTNSNVKHKLAGSEYPVRVAQCQEATTELQKHFPGIELLRDVSPEQVNAIEGRVEDAVFRRARHVVTENARTVAAARALKDGDYATVGDHMLDSHRSLREDYEVSCPELDLLVELAMEVEGVFGSRMTGGGFGGCTVTLVEKDSVDGLLKHLKVGYLRATGRECSCFVTKPGFGARGLVGAAAATGTAWPEPATSD